MSEVEPSKHRPGGLEVAPGVVAPPGALRTQTARSGGPGGQNVNKVNTKVEIWVTISGLVGMEADARDRLRHLAGHRLTQGDELHIVAETERSQESNRTAVMERLRELLVAAQRRPTRRRKTRPTGASRKRRLTAKKVRASRIQARRSDDDA